MSLKRVRNMSMIEQQLVGAVNSKREVIHANLERNKAFEDEREQNKERAKMILLDLDRNVIDISQYTSSYKSYKEFIEYYYSLIKRGFEYKFYREHPIKFKFSEESKDVYELQFRHFITNIFLWCAVVYLEPRDLDESHIVDCTKIGNDLIDTYLNKKVVLMYQHLMENKKINIGCHDTKYNLGRISADFNDIMGVTINAETFIDIGKRIPEFKEILDTQMEDDLQPSQIEQKINTLNKRQIQLVTEDREYNPLGLIFKSGTGIKSGQFKELVVNAGLKSDLSGSTVPASIKSNFLKHGLNDLLSYFIDAIGGRKPMVVNATDMGDMGHLSRLMSLSSGNFRLRKDGVKDCGTVNSLRVFIRDMEHLARFKKRYFRRPTEFHFRPIKGDEEDLVGTEIFVRSPTKCASHDEEGVCHKCYGDLYYTNKDLQSAGIFSAKQIAEPVMQNMLSTKHLNATNSDDLIFTDNFDDYFDIKSNEIVMNPDVDFSGFHLLIKRADITILEESDSGIDSYLSKFYIVDTINKQVHCVEETNNNIMYMSPTLKDEMMEYAKGLKKGKSPMKDYVDEDVEYIELALGDIPMNSVLFVAEIRNNELTKPLVDIRYLVDYYVLREELGIHNDIDGIMQKFTELLIDSGVVAADAVHAEVVFSMFIRSVEDDLSRPDFRRYDADNNTKVLTLSQSLKNNPSITVSLAFQDYDRQFRSEITYKKKAGSYLDSYFRKVPQIIDRD